MAGAVTPGAGAAMPPQTGATSAAMTIEPPPRRPRKRIAFGVWLAGLIGASALIALGLGPLTGL